MMNHLMLDIETLGVRNNASIMQIACVPFKPLGFDSDGVRKNVFYENIDFIDCAKRYDGFTYDDDTISFWNNQPENRKKSLLQNQKPIKEVLKSFREYLLSFGDFTLWCHVDFDIPILRNAFEVVLGENMPYRYYHRMDIRTIFKLYKFDIREIKSRNAEPHNAFFDCLNQIECVRSVLEENKRNLN